MAAGGLTQRDDGGGDPTKRQAHIAFTTGSLLSNDALIHRWTNNRLDTTLGRRTGTLDIGCEYDSFRYASVIGSCGLDLDSAQHRDGNNTIVGDRGV